MCACSAALSYYVSLVKNSYFKTGAPKNNVFETYNKNLIQESKHQLLLCVARAYKNLVKCCRYILKFYSNLFGKSD